jgi:hypothetical protein
VGRLSNAPSLAASSRPFRVEGKQRVAILDQALDSLVMTPQISMKASNAASRGLGPFYNRATPELFGFPFFYWYQLLWVPLTSFLTYIVYRTLGRRTRDDG